MLLHDEYLFSDLQLWGENAVLIELCQLLISVNAQSYAEMIPY